MGAFADGAELNLIEEGIQCVKVGKEPGVFPQVQWYVEVIHQLVEATVTAHVLNIFAKGLPFFAFNVVLVGDHPVKVAVFG